EYGVTTRRAPRGGWYASVIARYATRVNGITDMALTKLDILTGFEKIPVCVAYDVDGVRYDEMPLDQTAFHHAKPIYEELDGWAEDISGARTFEDLPVNAQRYVHAVEEMSGTRMPAIGVGPGRDAIIPRHDLIHWGPPAARRPRPTGPGPVGRRRVRPRPVPGPGPGRGSGETPTGGEGRVG